MNSKEDEIEKALREMLRQFKPEFQNWNQQSAVEFAEKALAGYASATPTAGLRSKEEILAKHWKKKYPEQRSGYDGSLFKGNESWVLEAMQEYKNQSESSTPVDGWIEVLEAAKEIVDYLDKKSLIQGLGEITNTICGGSSLHRKLKTAIDKYYNKTSTY